MSSAVPEKDLGRMPCLITRKGVVVDAKGPLFELTGYAYKELAGKDISSVFRELLRSEYDANCDENWRETFIFTRSLDSVEVDVYTVASGEEKLYYLSDKPYLRLDIQFPPEYELPCENKVGIAIFSSPDFILLSANQKYLDINRTPYNTREGSIGKRLKEILPPELIFVAMSLWETVAEKKRVMLKREVIGTSSDWKGRFFNFTIIPVIRENAVKFIIFISEDVTSGVEAKLQYSKQNEIIKRQNGQLEAIIESISDALFIINPDGSLVPHNQAAKVLFQPSGDSRGVSVNYFEQARFLKLKNPKTSTVFHPVRLVMRGIRFMELQILAGLPHANYYINMSGTPVFDAEGKFQMGILCCRDITEKLKNTELIGVQRHQLEAIMDNVSEIIFILDTTGKIFYSNKAARDYFQCPETKDIEEILSKGVITDFEGNLMCFGELSFSISRQLKSFEHSSFVLKSDNKTLYFDVTTVPILDGNGNMVYVLMSANDISEHINNQIQMRSKNDMLQQIIQTKDEFLSLISHEFKTPLTVINAAIQAMELICGNEMSEKARGFIKKIRQNTYRQIRLVNNLLDLSRTNAGHLKLNLRNSDIVTLTRAITESVGIYAGQKGLNLAFTTNTEKKMIGIDEEKYERILLNLLSNAIKFSPKGSTVSVSIHVSDRGVNIEVSDEGIGIPSDKLEIIFQRFGQVDSSLSRQAEGTGIGLSLVKLFIEAMDGTISVKSHPGAGSTFTVSLPDRSATAKEKAEALIIDPADSRIIQATKIEFSDIYL